MPQLKAYHRPTTIREALALLARPNVKTTIIGGGTTAIAGLDDETDEALDLQDLGLIGVSAIDDYLTMGAMTRLQEIVDDAHMPDLVRDAAYRAGPNTQRNAATIGGTVVSANPESELLAALLVHDAVVMVQSNDGGKLIPLAAFLADIPAMLGAGFVITVTMATSGKTASDRVARTPADSPIVAAAARRTDGGEIRLALCGVAETPILVAPEQVEALNPVGDFRGSPDYRRQMAVTLARRVVGAVLE